MATTSVHADPPPPLVYEPRGIRYLTGEQLGKGGFAICHRAEVFQNDMPTGKIVALKIVKAHLEPAKMAQKVDDPGPGGRDCLCRRGRVDARHMNIAYMHPSPSASYSY